MIEHNPENCGCKYLGNDIWDCGHIDGIDNPDETSQDTILQSYDNLLNYVVTEHEQDHDDGYCDDEKSTCLTCAWLVDAKTNFQELAKQGPIIVTVSGGVVQDVSGIPSGLSVHVHDYDTDGQEGFDDDNIKTDATGDKYILGIYEN